MGILRWRSHKSRIARNTKLTAQQSARQTELLEQLVARTTGAPVLSPVEQRRAKLDAMVRTDGQPRGWREWMTTPVGVLAKETQIRHDLSAAENDSQP